MSPAGSTHRGVDNTRCNVGQFGVFTLTQLA